MELAGSHFISWLFSQSPGPPAGEMVLSSEMGPSTSMNNQSLTDMTTDQPDLGKFSIEVSLLT